jgi:3-hydroxyacyl-CoA dehydrogenase
MTLVESFAGAGDGPATMTAAIDLGAGKMPIEAAAIPLIANRILMPMINEAIRGRKVPAHSRRSKTPRARHEPPDGSATLADFIGPMSARHHERAARRPWRSGSRACPLLKRMVAAGQLGVRAAKASTLLVSLTRPVTGGLENLQCLARRVLQILRSCGGRRKSALPVSASKLDG